MPAESLLTRPTHERSFLNTIEQLAANSRIECDSPTNVRTEIVHRAMGALLGAACADALGAPFEFGPSGRYSQVFPKDVRSGTGELIGGGSFDWQPGEFTDDSQMMLALAESLSSRRALDLDDLWRHFLHWQRGATDCGLTTLSALRHETWRGAAERAHAAGAKSSSNGALMRVWPIAIAFHHAHPSVCMAAALAQARTTHFHPLAGWSSAIGAEMCRRAINGHDPLHELDDIITLVPLDLQDRFRSVLHESWDPFSEVDADNGTALICLAQAVWALRHGSDFAQVARLAIDLGGDTDTVACVAGAIAGARSSVQGIPGRWLAYVNGSVTLPSGTRREYRYRELLDVARALLGMRPSHLTATERPARPRRVDDHYEIYASDLGGAIESSEEFAVVSLCLVDRRLDKWEVRREIFMRDEEDDANTDLLASVRDAVNDIDALLAAGSRVLVHCHGGRSRTGLVLKAWAMRAHGMSADEAHHWLSQRWDRYAAYRLSFLDLLAGSWADEIS